MEERSARTRDKERTKRRLVEAAIEILRENGFEDLGVNAVADRAGVSKVLLYRYFGDMSGLYTAIAAVLDPLQSKRAEELRAEIDPNSTTETLVSRTVMELHAALKNDELTKNLLVWELNHANAATETLAEVREKTGLALTEQFRERIAEGTDLQDLDINAVLAVMTASIFYLTLRSDTVRDFNGVNIQSEEGWKRIAGVFSRLLS